VFSLLSAPFCQAPPPDDVNSHIGWGGREGRIEGKGYSYFRRALSVRACRGRPLTPGAASLRATAFRRLATAWLVKFLRLDFTLAAAAQARRLAVAWAQAAAWLRAPPSARLRAWSRASCRLTLRRHADYHSLARADPGVGLALAGAAQACG